VRWKVDEVDVMRFALMMHGAYVAVAGADAVPWKDLDLTRRRRYLAVAKRLLERGVRLPEDGQKESGV
jgi:hypothetical protein